MEIRPKRESDAEAIAATYIRSWQAAYRGLIDDAVLDGLDATFARRVDLARRLPDLWVAEDDGAVVGHVSIGASRDADAPAGTGEVNAIYLSPEAWGKGIGRALLAHAVAELGSRGFHRATLWVLDSNARARRFYEAAGWRADGAEKAEVLFGVTVREVRYAVELS